MINFVAVTPTFPAPTTPNGSLYRSGGNQAEFQKIPAVNEFPAKPNNREQAGEWR